MNTNLFRGVCRRTSGPGVLRRAVPGTGHAAEGLARPPSRKTPRPPVTRSRTRPEEVGHECRGCLQEGRPYRRRRLQESGPCDRRHVQEGRQRRQGRRPQDQDRRVADDGSKPEGLARRRADGCAHHAGLHLEYVSPCRVRGGTAGTTFWASPPSTARPAPGRRRPPGFPVAQVNTPVLRPVRAAVRGLELRRAGRVRAARAACASGAPRRCCLAASRSPERDFAGPRAQAPARHSTLHEATAQAYAEICATLDAHRLPAPAARVELPSGHQPRLRTAPSATGSSTPPDSMPCAPAAARSAGSVPAASALGATSDSPLVVYFLAGRIAPVFVENPAPGECLSLPAAQYGTHSPVFSRAALLRQSGQPHALHLRHREHRRTPFAARRRHRGADARDAHQHRGAAERGQPARPRRAL